VAHVLHQTTGKAARVFTGFAYVMRKMSGLCQGRAHELLRSAKSVTEIATAAQNFGQEDDISVISITRTAVLETAMGEVRNNWISAEAHSRSRSGIRPAFR
jgi:hypothetical protein